MSELGVADLRFLGGPGRCRDSGMMGAPTNDAAAGVLAGRPGRGGRQLVEVVREVRPQVAGHLRRERRLRAPGPHPGAPGRDGRGRRGRRPGLRAGARRGRGTSPKVYWPAMPSRRCSDGHRRDDATAGDTRPSRAMDPADEPPFVVPDELVAARGRRPTTTPSEDRARCGRTPARSPSTGRSSRCPTSWATTCSGMECYRLVRGEPGPGRARPRDRPLRRAELSRAPHRPDPGPGRGDGRGGQPAGPPPRAGSPPIPPLPPDPAPGPTRPRPAPARPRPRLPGTAPPSTAFPGTASPGAAPPSTERRGDDPAADPLALRVRPGC